MKKTISFLLGFLTFACVSAQNISLQQKRLTHNWQFVREDLGGIWEAIRISKPGDPTSVPGWQNVNLPHCFNATDAVNPDVNYYEGPGWYKTSLEINNPFPQGHTLLLFEGAGQKTQLFVGMQKAGSHVGGYDEWMVDITDKIAEAKKDTFINKLYKGSIPISIRCDNSRDLQMIPSDLSDFTIYGGLYRYVDLIFAPEIYTRQVHLKAVPNQDLKSGKLQIKSALINDANKPVQITIKILAPDGTLAAERTLENQKRQISVDIPFSTIKLWSPERPELYSFSMKIKSSSGEQDYTDHFAFRQIRFDEHGPFYLNNERLLLHGTHRHEDGAGVGAAETEPMIRKEMLLMKKMGINFIRLAHYQQSRIVLNLCDSLGILVWEEIPWCRGGLGNQTYQAQAHRMLTHMIAQHYNHPSVIIWGLGNENDWPGDFPEFDKTAIRNFMSSLNDQAHKLDSSRETSVRRCDFCKDIVDVYSPSIWAGWYRGKYTEYMAESRKNMLQVDHFLHAEWGGDSQAGRHSEKPDIGLTNVSIGQGTDERAGDASLVGGQARVSRDGDWSETYICNLFDWTLKEQEKMPWLTGTAFWIFKDFATPVRPENPIPYVNQKGVVSRDIVPKESYYVFQSYWTNLPMIHIYGHTWPTRWGDPNEEKLVKVYSNCPEIELFVNGNSYGTKLRNSQDFPAAGFHWNVKFKEGINKIKAVGKDGGKTLIDSIQQNYVTYKWGVPEKMTLKVTPVDEHTSWLEVRLNDAKGDLCLDAKNRVEFGVTGDAYLVADLGTVDGSRKVEVCNGIARIKVTHDSQNWMASVKSPGIPTEIYIPKRNGNN